MVGWRSGEGGTGPTSKLFAETGTIWQNAPKPQVKLALGMILVAACQEICDVK